MATVRAWIMRGFAWPVFFIEALALERPHVLGLSFGAALALEFRRRHPLLPRRLVLAGAYAGWAGSLPPEVVADRLGRLLREAELPPVQWVPAYVPGMLTESAPQAMVVYVGPRLIRARPNRRSVRLVTVRAGSSFWRGRTTSSAPPTPVRAMNSSASTIWRRSTRAGAPRRAGGRAAATWRVE